MIFYQLHLTLFMVIVRTLTPEQTKIVKNVIYEQGGYIGRDKFFIYLRKHYPKLGYAIALYYRFDNTEVRSTSL